MAWIQNPYTSIFPACVAQVGDGAWLRRNGSECYFLHPNDILPEWYPATVASVDLAAAGEESVLALVLVIAFLLQLCQDPWHHSTKFLSSGHCVWKLTPLWLYPGEDLPCWQRQSSLQDNLNNVWQQEMKKYSFQEAIMWVSPAGKEPGWWNSSAESDWGVMQTISCVWSAHHGCSAQEHKRRASGISYTSSFQFLAIWSLGTSWARAVSSAFDGLFFQEFSNCFLNSYILFASTTSCYIGCHNVVMHWVCLL